MKPSTVSWLCLGLFIVYCVDLTSKVPDLPHSLKILPLWIFVLALTVRFAFMAGLFWGFIFFRRKAKQNQLK